MRDLEGNRNKSAVFGEELLNTNRNLDSTYLANYKYTHQFGLTAQAKRKMWDPIHGLLIDRESKIPLMSTAASHYSKKTSEGPQKIFSKKHKKRVSSLNSLGIIVN